MITKRYITLLNFLSLFFLSLDLNYYLSREHFRGNTKYCDNKRFINTTSQLRIHVASSLVVSKSNIYNYYHQDNSDPQGAYPWIKRQCLGTSCQSRVYSRGAAADPSPCRYPQLLCAPSQEVIH